jgi:TPR repeat protein
VTIAGLAKGTDLSLGSSQGQAGWLLSARDLEKTFVGPPKDFVGVMDAKVKLSSADGQLLDSRVLRLEWTEKKEADSLTVLAAPEPTPVVPSLTSEQIAALIKLAEDLLRDGDFATARILLKRAAIAGNAQAALELGLTFDQTFLSASGSLGGLPDAAQARAWYQRAIKLGSTEASRHLQQLANAPM